MFGKGGGALGAWIKEFCQLVFIQTIQAFIYAIIITVIMSLYSQAVSATENSSGFDYATGLGLFSVIALVSVFKIEDIARKLFGFGPTKADHGGAVKSIAKTAFALKLGGRVLDNAKKIGGGAKNWLGANKDAKKAASRLERRKQALLKDNAANDVEDTKPTESIGTAINSSTSQNEETRKLLEKRRKMQSMSSNMRAKAQNLNLTPEHKAELLAKADKLDARAKGIDEALEARLLDGAGSSQGAMPSGNVTTASSTGGNNRSSSKSSNYHQAMLNLQEQYEKELSDAKKKRKEGFRTMTKGVMETGGAIVGATAGGILGFAGGEVDEGVQGMLGGAGLGDTAGEFAANTVFGSKDLVEGAVKATTGAVKDYSSNIKRQYEDERKAAISQIKDLNNEAAAEVKRINKNAEKARENLEKEIELSAGQTAKAMAKAVGKGSVKAYKSRHGGIKQLSNSIKDLENHINTASKDIKLDNNVESID